jgi:hypothetical protein
VIELLNNAQMGSGENSKLECLKIVQEIIVHKVRRLLYLPFFRKGTDSFGKESLNKNLFQNPDLLDNFLDEMLAFQTDRSQEVCV